MRQLVLGSLPILSLILFIFPFSSTAQTFRASSVTLGSKGVAYELDVEHLHTYVENQQGAFPLSIAFSDTLEWIMEMERFDIRSKNYRLRTSAGAERNTSNQPPVTYKGTLAGEPDSEVRMTLTDGYFRAFVRESSESSYYVEMKEDVHSGSVVTILEEVSDEDPGYCASGSEHHVHSHDGSKQSNTQLLAHLAPYEAEIAFVVDRLGYEQYDSLEELELELLTIMNYTDAYYAIHDLTYKLTEIYVIEDLQSQPWSESDDAGQMLDNFTSWASGSTPLQHHDVVTLWSGIDFGSTIGIAWVGAIGSPYRQNVVNFPKGRERRNSNVHAHELGHNWGSGHVNGGGWMMSAFLSNANEEAQWNQSVINAFPGYVADAMQHLDDVGTGDGGDGGGGDGGDDGSTILSVNYGQLTISNEENGNGLLDPGETADLNLVIENLDANPIDNLVVTITPDNNRAVRHVTLNNDQSSVEMLDGNTSTTVAFNATLSLEAPIDRTFRFLIELSDGTRTSETTLSITSGDQFLPVDLISFTGVQVGERVMLQWETASEINNAGFEVEFQSEGGEFRRLAFVAGAGTTLEAQRYSYLVESIGPGAFGFRLKQIDFDGTFEYSDVVHLTLLPNAFTLKQNYPNPFNPQTRIEFHMPSAGLVLLEVYDMLGRRVAVLVDEHLQAGQHAAIFDASDLSNGTYVYRLRASSFEETRTMILMK